MELTYLKDKVQSQIYDIIDEIQLTSEENKIFVKSPETALYGSSSGLDSLELVNLIVALEQKIFDEFAKTITIADEKALSLKHSPFRTIESLTEYVLTLISE